MKKVNNRKTTVVLSVTALVLALILAAGATFSWAEGGNRAYVNGTNLTISTGSDLTMRTEDGRILDEIFVPACTLEETSSVDGRNFFFPVDYNKNGGSNTIANDYVFFKNTNNWSNVKVHCWIDGQTDDDDVSLTTWPGAEMYLLKDNIYYYKLPEEVTGLMFTGGDNGSSNTGNLSVSSGKGKLYNNGAWEPYDSNFVDTNQLLFREGTAADENKKYISLDFNIESGSKKTNVFLGAGTIVQCENHDVMKALRMSFNFNDGSDPIVFQPSQMPGITASFNPVSTISVAGVATTSANGVNTESYGDYYFKGNENEGHLFSLEAGETKNITLTVWLEGTEFDGNSVAGEDISIRVDFTTYSKDLVEYNFVDNTHGYNGAQAEYWITNKADKDKYETMMYLYDNTSQRYYAMSKSDDYSNDHKWSVYVPNTINDFYFRRYSISVDTYWNQWEPDMGDAIVKDPNEDYTYVAICGNTVDAHSKNNGCYGYWKDEKDTIRVYFQLETNWDNLKCYASDDKTTDDNGFYPLGSYPGTKMEFSHNAGEATGTVDKTKPLYYIDIEGASRLTHIIFNNSNTTQQIKISKEFLFNGFAIWYNGSKSGNFIYTDSIDSLIHPDYQP